MLKIEWVSQDPNSMNKFLEDFEMTNNPEHYVTSSEIHDWNEDHKNGISDTKMGRDITTYAAKHKMDNVIRKIKKINGKSTQVWVGIRTNEGDLGI